MDIIKYHKPFHKINYYSKLPHFYDTKSYFNHPNIKTSSDIMIQSIVKVHPIH